MISALLLMEVQKFSVGSSWFSGLEMKLTILAKLKQKKLTKQQTYCNYTAHP